MKSFLFDYFIRSLNAYMGEVGRGRGVYKVDNKIAIKNLKMHLMFYFYNLEDLSILNDPLFRFLATVHP